VNDPDRSLVNSERYRNNCSTLASTWPASASAEIAIDRRAASAAEAMRNLIIESSVLGGTRSAMSAAHLSILWAVDCGESSWWRVGAGTTIPDMLEPLWSETAVPAFKPRRTVAC
jgi:hypothetical protein